MHTNIDLVGNRALVGAATIGRWDAFLSPPDPSVCGSPGHVNDTPQSPPNKFLTRSGRNGDFEGLKKKELADPNTCQRKEVGSVSRDERGQGASGGLDFG